MNQDYFRRNVEEGENIFSEGEPSGIAYLVHSGKVRLHKNELGMDVDIDIIGPGNIFGEMGVISSGPRMASATAVEDTVLTCCYKREMMRRVDGLDKDTRDALRFLIKYCQEFLPFELMAERPDDAETKRKDALARLLVQKSDAPKELDGFLTRLYQVLIGYAERRLPPK